MTCTSGVCDGQSYLPLELLDLSLGHSMFDLELETEMERVLKHPMEAMLMYIFLDY